MLEDDNEALVVIKALLMTRRLLNTAITDGQVGIEDMQTVMTDVTVLTKVIVKLLGEDPDDNASDSVPTQTN